MKRLLLTLLLLASPAFAQELLNTEYCDFQQISGLTGDWDSDVLSSMSVDSVGRVAAWTSKVINPATSRRESFVQATDAQKPVRTRGDSRENLLTYSSDLSNAAWTATDATKTDADTITVTAQNGKVLQNVATVAGQSYKFSVELKNTGGNADLHLLHTDSATGNSTAQTITNDWARYSVTVLGKTGSGNVSFGIQDQNAAGHGTVDFRNAQVQHANAHPTYIATTTTPVYRGSTTGRSGVRFDGVDDNMTSVTTGAEVFAAGAKTIIAVVRQSTVLNQQRLFKLSDNKVILYSNASANPSSSIRMYNTDASGADSISANAIYPNNIQQWLGWHSGGYIYSQVGGGSVFSAASDDTTALTGTLVLAAHTSEYFNGDPYRILTFNKVLDSQTRDRITKCLQWKYGAK